MFAVFLHMHVRENSGCTKSLTVSLSETDLNHKLCDILFLTVLSCTINHLSEILNKQHVNSFLIINVFFTRMQNLEARTVLYSVKSVLTTSHKSNSWNRSCSTSDLTPN